MDIIICIGRTVIPALIRTVTTMKANDRVRNRYLDQVKALQPILQKIQRKLAENYALQNDQEIQEAMSNLEHTLKDGIKYCENLEPSSKCFSEKWKQRGNNLMFGSTQTRTLDNLDEALSHAMEIANLAMQLVVSGSQDQTNRYLKRLEQSSRPHNPCAGVFSVGEPPVGVTNVSAEPNQQSLIVKWKDEGNEQRQVTKYLIMLNREDNFYVECTDFSSSNISINIAHLLEPWHAYSVQVCAVSRAGCGPWSEPPCNVAMNKCPPVKPDVKFISAPSGSSLCFQITRPDLHNQQQITHCIVKKKIIDEISSNWEAEEIDYVLAADSDVCIIYANNLQTRKIYKLQICLCNQWGESEPNMDFCTDPICIACLIPQPPQKIFFIKESRTHNEIWITWKPPKRNQGAVQYYIVEKRWNNSTWEEATFVDNHPFRFSSLGELNTSHFLGVFSPYQRMALIQRASEMRSSAEQNGPGPALFQMVNNLKQNTNYQFRVRSINFMGVKSLPSERLQVETKIHPVGRHSIAATCVITSGMVLITPLAYYASKALMSTALHYSLDKDKYADLQEPSDSENEEN